MIDGLKHGEQAGLARKIGITPRHMNDIIKQRKRPSRTLSEKLEAETGISAEAWLFPDKHPNPLLKGNTPLKAPPP
ncbi:MAG TPA: hypothetical protein PLM79_16920 [Syntrophobacteraceae bacterium]|nr:hypothetical protein [Syntrophobacteraceae bacterium]